MCSLSTFLPLETACLLTLVKISFGFFLSFFFCLSNSPKLFWAYALLCYLLMKRQTNLSIIMCPVLKNKKKPTCEFIMRSNSSLPHDSPEGANFNHFYLGFSDGHCHVPKYKVYASISWLLSLDLRSCLADVIDMHLIHSPPPSTCPSTKQ